MRCQVALLAASTMLLGAGCGLAELTPAERVVRDRVLAIKASPPEIGLGETTTLEALLASPEALGTYGEDYTFFWTPCVASDIGVAGTSACSEALLPEEDDPLAFFSYLQETFTFTADHPAIEGALDMMTPERRLEGIGVIVNLIVIPMSFTELIEQLGESGENEDGQALFSDPPDDWQIILKRVEVSDKSALPEEVELPECAVDELLPNANPELLQSVWVIDEEQALAYNEGGDLPADATPISVGRQSGASIRVSTASGPLFFVPQFAPESREDYLYVTTDLVAECRQEDPNFAWFSSAATNGFSGNNSFLDLDGTQRAKAMGWALPDDFDTPVDVWLVMRDWRGGIDWMQWTLIPEASSSD